MDAKRNARDDQAKGAALRSELMRGGKRKVPRKILVAAVAGLLLCVAVIVGVVLAFSAFDGRNGPAGADDIPPLLDADKNVLLQVGYDPGMTHYDSDAEGLYVNVGDQRCVMEGDQRAVSGFIQECVDSALAEYEDGVSGDHYDFDPTVPHTWVSEDDLDAYESAQAGASASAA